MGTPIAFDHPIRLFKCHYKGKWEIFQKETELVYKYHGGEDVETDKLSVHDVEYIDLLQLVCLKCGCPPSAQKVMMSWLIDSGVKSLIHSEEELLYYWKTCEPDKDGFSLVYLDWENAQVLDTLQVDLDVPSPFIQQYQKKSKTLGIGFSLPPIL